MNRQQSLRASLRDLLNTNNGIFSRFTWFYCGDYWIREIKQIGDKAQIVIIDRKDIPKTLTLELSTKVRNYEH